MKFIKSFMLVLLSWLPLLAFCDFTLVRNGEAEAVILLDAKATKSAQLGAFELQHHVKLMTGAQLPILQGKAPAGKNIIKIGGDNKGLTGDSSKIEFKGNTLLLTGNDSLIYGKVDYNKPTTFPQVEYECKGSLFAVYDFLEYYCGVRFYGMDEVGTFYKETKNLSVKEKNRIYSPQMDAFRFVWQDDKEYTKIKISPRDYALWQLRWRMSSLFGMTNHNQYSIYFAHWGKAKMHWLGTAFKEKRKELFAKGFDGKNADVDPILRNNYRYDKDLPPQLCYSNKGTVKYYANEVLTYFNGGNVRGGWKNFHGDIPTNRTLVPRFEGKPYFYPIQGGDTGGHCLCSDCKNRFPNDTKDDVSNNKFQFIADVAREAAKTNPAAGVSSLAYIQTLRYPDKVSLPPNVSVQMCLTLYSWWHPVSYQKQMDAYKEWVAKEAKRRPLTLWTYLFSTYWDARLHFGGYKPFPGLYPWKTGEMFKMFAKDGIRGWFTEVELQYNQLEAYVAAMICYDPSLDPNKIIDEYFENYYGAAGPAMKEFYREIEKAYWNPANCPPEWLKRKDVVIGPKGVKHPYWGTGLHSQEVNWAMGTPARMKKLNGLIEKAKKLVKTPNEKIRLQRLIDCVWTNTLEGAREYQLHKLKKSELPYRLRVSKEKDLNGDFTKVDWSKAVKTQIWTNPYGGPAKRKCHAELAADSKYLYIKIFDAQAPERHLMFWREDIEIFFLSGKSYPVYQLAVNPDGEVEQYKYVLKNGKAVSGPYDFKAKVKSEATNKSWAIMMAIPLNKLPLKGSQMSLNFMRTTPSERVIWNPTYTNFYLQGIDCYGVLNIYPQIIQAEQFTYHDKGKSSDMVKDAAALNGNAGRMRGNSGWSVQYVLPKDFIPGKYKVAVSLRVDAPYSDGLRNAIGLYDQKMRKVIASKNIDCKNSISKKYNLFELGTWDLKPGRYIYIGGLSKKMAEANIYMDYIRLIPVNNK